MSSPVSLFGPGNHNAKPSSIRSPVAGSRTRASEARRAAGTRPISVSSARPARGPEIRTTATAAGGRPEERAKMVSRSLDMSKIASSPQTHHAVIRSSVSGGSVIAALYMSLNLRAPRNMSSSSDPTHENRLARETSPYLLQHKHNPVDWWPWGPEALAEAQRSNRPILLSVGYAACHWCHVMAHESFEDQATADVMNELFVNIKVDREERPDIDQIYMSALHHLGEQGGWPLTMFLTPTGEPVWGGTYFPKTSRYGRPAFVDVLREVSRLFRDEPGKIAQNREALMARLSEAARPAGRVVLGAAELDRLAAQVAGAFDPVHGGLRGAPKFPNAAMYEFLWR